MARVSWRCALKLSGIFSTLLFAGIAGGCTDDSAEAHQYDTSLRLQAITSCDELNETLIESMTERFLTSSVLWGYWYGVPEVDAGIDAPTDENGGDDGPSDYTDTNVQEAGVDEPDLVKTDGERMFILQDNTLRIFDSWPAEQTQQTAEVEVEGYGEELFLMDDIVITLTSLSTYYYGCPPNADCALPEPGIDEEERESYDFSGTRATVIDVSDIDNPQILRTFDIEGNRISARAIDGTIYLVSSHYAGWSWEYNQQIAEAIDLERYEDVPYDERDELAERLRPAVRAEVSRIVNDGDFQSPLLPDVRINDGERAELFGCGDLYRPPTPSTEQSVLSVVAFDPRVEDAPRGSGLLATGWHVYGSQNALYIARDSREWSWIRDDRPEVRTDIHRFTLADGDPFYSAAGSVPGFIKDRYSMSEYDGYLRIATTDAPTWWFGGVAVDAVDVPVASDGGSSEPVGDSGEEPAVDMGTPANLKQDTAPPVQANNLFVLQDNDGDLEIVGEARGFGPDEDIYAVRYMGEIAYVVTFRQIDPLFAIDITDPTNPTVRGDLEITGFSNYLHPLGDDHLIGLGREANLDGRITGFQIQLFDVSDLDNPIRTDQEIIEFGPNTWGGSEADYDPRAFTFSSARNLLAIPVNINRWDRDGGENFSGIIAYRVTPEDGITEIGRIAHEAFSSEYYCDNPDSDYSSVECDEYGYPWWVQMRRAVFIEDYLYAISSLGMTVSASEAYETPIVSLPFYSLGSE